MSQSFWSDWGPAIAVAVPAIAAILAGFIGYHVHKVTARRTLTFTHLANTDSDKDLIDARKTFIREASKPEGLTAWADPGREQSKECQAIRLVLNDFELVSVGIQEGIVDYDLYEKYYKSVVIKYWYAAAPFVYSIRKQTGSRSIYHEFEELCRCFEKDRPPKRHFGFNWKRGRKRLG